MPDLLSKFIACNADVIMTSSKIPFFIAGKVKTLTIFLTITLPNSNALIQFSVGNIKQTNVQLVMHR